MAPEAPSTEPTEERVLQIVRQLALEVGGERAATAASPAASLEREIGLGSLERVELLVRLEAAFGRSLGDEVLRLDTPAELSTALRVAAKGSVPAVPEREAAVGAATAAPKSLSTVHEVLWRRAEADPERPTVYLTDDEGREQTVTYGRLLKESNLVAGGLRERGIRKRDTVALMLPTGMDFLRAFQGILISGAIPVPIYPPLRLDRLEEYAQRQAAILADAGVRLLITVPRALPIAELLRPSVPSLTDVATADELVELGASWPAPEGSGADAAFIQYTSGSTGSPKGVLLSHDNLLANIRAISQALQAGATDVGVSWLPLYHDMGLIGSWLFCMYEGLPIAILSPMSFLARPERWLQTIHRRRGTLSAGPNFAYELCVRKIPDSALEGLDLSSWRGALNGSEPVNPDTLERFTRRFAPHGLRRQALLPVYGLAENAVGLCFPPVGRGPRVDHVARPAFEQGGRAERAAEDETSALRFVSVGTPLPGHEIRIVGDAGEELPERAVGRLLFRGPSQMREYYRNPTATAAIRRPGGWLDSGDLAYRADGEVFITGRRKDLIIKAGRNLIPQEIEEVASEVPGVRKGCVVAVGIVSEALGTERLVVVAETRVSGEERDALATAITERVATSIGIPPDGVELVPPGTVPKTSSGKIRRASTKELYLKGELGRPSRLSLRARLRLLAAATRAHLRPRLVAAGRGLRGAYLALILVPVLLLAWLVGWVVPGRRAALAIPRWFFALALRAIGCRLTVEGLENLRRDGPSLMAANHASYVDIPALMALLPRSFIFVAKREVISWPLIGLFIRRAGHVTVERFDAPKSVADTSAIGKALEAGESVLVFPEGTFTGVAGLRPFRLGAFTAAVETGTSVLPLVLLGTRQVLRDGSWVPRPGRIHLRIGPPLAPEGRGWKAVVSLRNRVAEEISQHCGESVLDVVAGAPPRRAGES